MLLHLQSKGENKETNWDETEMPSLKNILFWETIWERDASALI